MSLIVPGARRPPYLLRATLANYLTYARACRAPGLGPGLAPGLGLGAGPAGVANQGGPVAGGGGPLWWGMDVESYDPLYLFEFRLPTKLVEAVRSPSPFFDGGMGLGGGARE